MAEVATKLYAPMLAKPSSLDFLRQVEDDPNWVAVEKFDGYRQLLYLSNQGNHLYSRYGNDHIANMPQFQTIVPELDGTVLDCEGMSPTRRLEDNAACFKAHSENAIAWQKANGNAYLVAFDVPAYKGRDITGEQFGSRRVVLESVFLQLERLRAFRGVLLIERLVFKDKEWYYDNILAQGGEGVILKDMFAPYQPGKRSNAWLKVKKLEQHRYYISGFMNGAGKYEGMVGSVIYAEKALEALVDIGTASGMDDETRIDMTVRPEFYVGKEALFECQRLTDRGCMRHPRYKGLVEEEK